jgi:hypothetical protein
MCLAHSWGGQSNLSAEPADALNSVLSMGNGTLAFLRHWMLRDPLILADICRATSGYLSATSVSSEGRA